MYLYTTILTLALATTGLSAPTSILSRDAADVMAALNMVTTSVKALDKAVKSLNSSTDAVALGNIANTSQAVGTTVKKAQTMVENTGPVSIFSALQVMTSANALSDSLTTTTIDLVKKKPIVAQAGLSSVVAMMLTTQKTASAGLSGAVADKVPALAKPIAQQSAKKVSDALDSAIKAFTVPGKAVNGTTPAASPATAAGNATLPAGQRARLVRV
jgi:hypothetical protein